MIVGDPVPLDDLRASPVTAATLKEATDSDHGRDHRAGGRVRGSEPPAERYDPRDDRSMDGLVNGPTRR